MKRTLLILIMLTLLLLIGRRVQAHPLIPAPPVMATSTWNWQCEIDTDDILEEESGFFGHAIVRDRKPSRDEFHSRLAPRREDRRICFRLRDRDSYRKVWIRGTFNHWEDEIMRRLPEKDYWEIRLELREGEHRYEFVIEDESGRVRHRSDPSNPYSGRGDRKRSKHSILRIGQNMEILGPYSSYELDIASTALVSYQRVDGFSLAMGPRFSSGMPYTPSLDALFGYGFTSERWSSRLDFQQPLRADRSLNWVISAYDQTGFRDQTGVGGKENSLSSWIFREDSRDYFRRQGITTGVEGCLKNLLLQVDFRSDEYGSLPARAHASWDWGREEFLPNPEVLEGMIRSLHGKIRLGNSLNHLMVEYEFSDEDVLSTRANFSLLTAQYRSRFRLGRSQYLDARVKIGSNFHGELPRQHRFLLGGIGTVRGYRYQSLLLPDPDSVRAPEDFDPAVIGGQTMFLANLEYVFGAEEDIQMVVFYDMGMAYEKRNADLDPSDAMSSVGVGVQVGDDESLRLNLIKTLDDGSEDIMIQARLKRMF